MYISDCNPDKPVHELNLSAEINAIYYTEKELVNASVDAAEPMLSQAELNQNHLHVHIRPGVWRRHEPVRRDRLEADRMIQADGRGEDVVRLEVKAACTGGAGSFYHGQEQLAADAASLPHRSNGHLGNFELVSV